MYSENEYHRLAVCMDWLCLTDHYGLSLKCTHQHSGWYTWSVGGTFGQWAVPSVSGRYIRSVGGTLGQWAVPSVSGQYTRSVGSTLGQWAVHSVSGRYTRSVLL